ncbi:MAG: negative regulator of beta-lactamase [Planctomycetota bacterium]|nr:MAG: negative regulator of beta-lactamase [Planctomycetota bacterium]
MPGTLLRLWPLLSLFVMSCAGQQLADAPRFGQIVTKAQRRGQEIVVCGQYVHVGTPVVLWSDPGGFNAYSQDLAFPEETGKRKDPPTGRRYGSRRKLPEDLAAQVAKRGWTLPLLQKQLAQFVFHYDVCGTSRQCFKVLQDLRGLSVHFMLDVDGTIYQSLDLKERAWHAGTANDRSVGVEIAQIGAYPRENHRQLATWHGKDAEGPFIKLPKWMKTEYLRKPQEKYRPARKQKISGVINGRRYWQYDFTAPQYEALTRLCAGLSQVFPKLRLECPVDTEGRLRLDALNAEERAAFEGFLGHWHVIQRKQDPGPAFDWERVLGGAKRLLAQP